MAISSRTFALLSAPFQGGGGPSHGTIELIWASGDASEYLGGGNKLQRVLDGLKHLRDGWPSESMAPDLPPDHTKLATVVRELAAQLLAAGLIDPGELTRAFARDGFSLDEDEGQAGEGTPLNSGRVPRSRLTLSRDDVERRINVLSREGEELLDAAKTVTDAESWERWTHDLERWHARGRAALAASYDGEGREAQEFYDAATVGIYTVVGQSDDETFANQRESTRGAINTLRSLTERLEFADPPPAATQAVPSSIQPQQPVSKRVFVVHGRNTAIRTEVARTLEALGLEPVILSEQVNQGSRSLIEKFEANALEVAFAVVVLSADDRGVGPDDADVPAAANRARQNVILELGYFMGRLGRSRVVPLYERAVELPSDLHGLAYTLIDDGGAWKYGLARELQAAGYDVDLNRVK